MLKLGSRVWRDDGESRGVVRFVGPIPELSGATAGEWIGVEWDTPIGKNDGSVKGVRYFSCDPCHGSFIRASKLRCPQFLSEMLRQRFSDNVPVSASIRTSGSNVFETKSPGSASTTFAGASSPPTGGAADGMYGEDGAAVEHQLAEDCPISPGAAVCFPNVKSCDCRANLDLQSVARAAPAKGALGMMFPNITDLTLTRTLLSDWAEVRAVLDELPHLSLLSVASNPLGGMPTDLFADCDATRYCALRDVNVSGTGLRKRDLWELLRVAPNVAELTACSNGWRGSLAHPSTVRRALAKSTAAAAGTDEKLGGGGGDEAAAACVARLRATLRSLRLDGNRFEALADVAELLLQPTTASLDHSEAARNGNVPHVVFTVRETPATMALEHLTLSGNPLRSLRTRGLKEAPCVVEDGDGLLTVPACWDSAAAAVLRNVHHVVLAGTLLADWDELIASIAGPGDASGAELERGEGGVPLPVVAAEVMRLPSVTDLALSETPMTEQLSQTERRRRLIGLLPKRLLKINRSHVTAAERLEAKKGVLLHFVAVKQGRAPSEPIPNSIAAQVEKECALDAQYSAGSPGTPQQPVVFKPRYMVYVFDVSLLIIECKTVAELARLRLGCFGGAIAEHLDLRREGGTPQLPADCRWTVGELEDNVAASLQMGLARTALRLRGDGWTDVNIAWGQLLRDHRLAVEELMSAKAACGSDEITADEFDGAADGVARQIVANSQRAALAALREYYFAPSSTTQENGGNSVGTLALFHVDVELMQNEDARRSGVHINNLVRSQDHLHTYRVQSGDVVVCVSLNTS